ncbi:MAG: F0F1 ATP synthase subunit A [Endomicrobium sp.]|nr:F0F1 ATP synthase subunit A [Endomicrobium sp.]
MQLNPEVLFSVANFPITNTVISTLITDIVIFMFVIIMKGVITINPGNVQNVVEIVIDYFIGITEEIAGDKSIFIYPWVVSFFIFIVISNLIAQLPGFELIKIHLTSCEHKVPLLRSATSDLNMTLALAVTSVFITNYLSIKHIGVVSYIKRFVSFKMFPVFLFVGMLEFVNEFTKFISFSFRLFGNIFAGEKILATMYGLFPIIFPLPFIILELMVAVVQAIVFSMLTMVFMHIMTDRTH